MKTKKKAAAKPTKIKADQNTTYHKFPGGCYARFGDKVAEVKANPSGVEIQWFKNEGTKQTITRVALSWEAAHATAVVLYEAAANIRPTFEAKEATK